MRTPVIIALRPGADSDRAPGHWVISTARAGGVPGIDVVHGGRQTIREFLSIIAAEGCPCVLRSRMVDLPEVIDALGELCLTRQATVVVADCWAHPVQDWTAVRTRIAAVGAQPVLEVTDTDRLHQLGVAVGETVVVRGEESGGPIGRSSTAMLLQQARGMGIVDIWCMGAIGPGVAAGLLVLGASGIVMRDELVLVEGSPLAVAGPAVIGADAADACAVGPDGARVRLLVRGTLASAREVTAMADACAHDCEPSADYRGMVDGLSFGIAAAWPLGIGIGVAGRWADQPVGRAVSGVRNVADDEAWPRTAAGWLSPDAPLAEAMGCQLPLVQGPMTRVSDIPAFAADVAVAGAMPVIALALMSGDRAEAVLQETREQLVGLAWGVGLLGFAPPEVYGPQRDAVVRAAPRLAVVAGARPEQVADLEGQGIAVFAHIPTSGMLVAQWGAGVRRIVLEGRECGGHVGPLPSGPLWEMVLSKLAILLTAAPGERAQVLLAGGIHNAATAASAMAIAAVALNDVANRVDVGLLMGTAYLFTREAVASGAIPEVFQRTAIECRGTRELMTAPGHATRVADTPFVLEFQSRARDVSVDARAETLEALTLGRLRIASRGEVHEGDHVVQVDLDRQVQDGMFMLGDAATLREEVVTLSSLHDDVVAGGRARLNGRITSAGPRTRPRLNVPVAIVGMAVIAPGAGDVAGFWRGVLDGRVATRTIPACRFDPERLRDPDPGAPDPTIAIHGGFIDPVPFDPVRFGTPPSALPHIEANQLLALVATRRAFADAGIDEARIDRSRVAVILGMSSGTGDLSDGYATRAMLGSIWAQPDSRAWDRLPAWTEESFPGFLSNVAAGRIANRFDFGGPNHTVDSACASSLAAVEAAIRELESGRTDMVVTGGADTAMSPRAFMSFAASHALSPGDRARVFDQAADGIVIGEAVSILLLKRLTDAERDGDRVYAVIRGSGSSSDGRGAGLTAPRSTGQRRALHRAYESSGIDPRSVGFYEAHGTGTVVGDRTEVETIRGVREEAGSEDGAVPCAIGSVKALVGHTKAAAGALGIVKAALSLHHRVLPGQPGVDHPLDSIVESGSSLELRDASAPWSADSPRRAAVSAFGFGGTNTHLVLEQHDVPGVPGARAWPAEIIAIGVHRLEDAPGRARALAAALDAPGAVLREVARAAVLSAVGPLRWAGVFADAPSARDALLERADVWSSGSSAGITDSSCPPTIALVFPGQGAQRVDSLRDAALYLRPLRQSLERSNSQIGVPLGRLLYPPPARDSSSAAAQRVAIADTRVAQAALGALGTGLADILDIAGITPRVAFGHSFGEFGALRAAGVLSDEALLELTRTRGAVMAAADPSHGTMAALASDEATVRMIVEASGVGSDLVIACMNAPSQSVVSGSREAVETVMAAAAEADVAAVALRVGGAFHSPLMATAEPPLTACINAIALQSPQFDVLGNADGECYPVDVEGVRGRMRRHLLEPVRFVDQIANAREMGVDLFVEVGPGSTATSLIRDCLAACGDVGAVAISMERSARPLNGVLDALVDLWVRGAIHHLDWLFEGRHVSSDERAHGEVAPDTWFVDGGGVRRSPDTGAYTNRMPLLGRDDDPGSPHAPDELEFSEAPFQRTMREFLRVHENVMAGALEGRPFLPAPVPAPPNGAIPRLIPAPVLAAPTPATEPITQSVVADGDPEEVLIALLADRTGFSPEMIGRDVDLEADLGVDSIKRVEVLTLLRERVNITRSDGADLSRLRTVREIMEALLADDPGGSPPATVASTTLPRLVMVSDDDPPLAPGAGPVIRIESDGTRNIDESDGNCLRVDLVTADPVEAAQSFISTIAEWPGWNDVERVTVHGDRVAAYGVVGAARSALLERGLAPRVDIVGEPARRAVASEIEESEWDTAGAVIVATGGGRGITRACLAGMTDATCVSFGRSACDVPWEHVEVDVRDADAVQRAVAEVLARHGRIDGIIHGAGVLHDAPLRLLDPDSVRAVLETKITGLAALVHAIQASDAAPPAWLVAFGSVSGRFGNPGQVAYGAANEAMSALAADVALQWPTTGVRVIQWGPWFDPRDPSLGMVTPPIAALLEERGIPPIRPADGVHALLVEVHHALATGGFEDVIRGDGPWAR